MKRDNYITILVYVIGSLWGITCVLGSRTLDQISESQARLETKIENESKEIRSALAQSNTLRSELAIIVATSRAEIENLKKCCNR